MFADSRKPGISGRAVQMQQRTVSCFSHITLPPDTLEEVYVCHITDPEHFYCHLAKNAPALDAMMEDIGKCYSSLGPSEETLPKCVLGSACIAQFIEDEGWYRAEVIGVLASGLIEVRFVDYGNAEIVTPDRIKLIKEKFLHQPVMALKCCLSGVTTQQGYWTPEHIAQFEDITLDQRFIAFIQTCRGDGVFLVELTNSLGLNINKEFGLKTSTICPNAFESDSNQRQVTIGQGDADLHVTLTDKKSNDSRDQNTEMCQMNEKPEVPEDQTVVSVTYVTTPSEFWCNLGQATILTDKLNIDYNRLLPGELNIDHPAIGMLCVAKYPADDMWYRGKIVAVQQGESKVFFIDYGNIATVPKGSLKQLLPYLKVEPPFAFKCSLYNVKPLSRSWTRESCYEFETLTLDKTMMATFHGKTKDGVMLITLRNYSNGSDIGECLIKKKLAVLKPSHSSCYPKADIKVPSTCEVYLSSIEHPNRFWVQLSEKQAQLDEFVEKIEGFYSTKGSPVISVHQGMPVVAKFSEDNAWYRAHIVKSSGGKHEVFFVDFGNTDYVSSNDLKEPTDDDLQVPVFAVECSLKDVAPLIQNSGWQGEAKHLIEDFTKDGAVCKFISVCNNSYVVELKVNDKDVASYLVSLAKARRQISDETCLVSPLGFPNSVSIPVKHLEKGYISHTDSVVSFWSQLSKYTAQLDELMEGLEAHYSLGHGVPLTNPVVGTPCVAKYSADNAWYRAVISKIDKNDITVHFIDYGNTEIIAPSSVCKIEKHFLEVPIQTVHCKLAVSMSAGTSAEAVNNKFMELVLEKELVIKVLSAEGSVLTVDVLDAGQSVTGMLKKEFSSLVISRTSTSSGLSDVLDFPPQQVPVGITKQVYISFLESPGLFFVHVEVDELLNDIMDKLSKQYVSASEPVLTNPRPDQPCCALYAEDGAWYRGKIISVTEENIKVKFIDYGNVEKVSKNNVKPLASCHLAVPPLAIQCALADVVPLGNTWTNEAIEFMEEITIDKEVQCTFKTADTVKLFVGGIDIADKLKEKGFAKSVASVSATIRALGTASSIIPGKQCELKKQKIPSGSIVVFVSHVDSNGIFYVQKASDEEAILTLSTELLNYYSNAGSSLNWVQKGTVCCAQFSDDDAWYRAVVEQITGGCATVRFVDFGNCDISSLKHLKVLEPQFCNEPPFAFACKLENITYWPSGIQEKFSEYTDNKELNAIFLDTTEPYTVRLLCNGKDLKSQFVFDDAPKEQHSKPKSSLSSPFGSKSPFGKPQSEFVEKKPNFGRPKTEPFSDEKSQKPFSASPPKKIQFSPTKKEVEVIPVDEQKFKAAVAPKGQITAFISHVEKDIIYIQQSKHIQSLVETSEKIRTLPLGTVQILVGFACGALFSEDKTWYRAEVIDISGDKIMVRFVDFGNTDKVSIDKLKPLNRELLRQERKALPCKIVGIDQMTPDLIDMLAEVTADKEIIAEFCSHEAPFRVKLKDMESNDIASIICPRDFPTQKIPSELVQGKVVNVSKDGIFSVLLLKDMELINQVKTELVIDFAVLEAMDSTKIEIGNACCVKLEEDSLQRAQVKSIKLDEIEVHLVDLGKNCVVNKNCIFSLHRRFLTFPPLSYECILNNFYGWNAEQMNKFVEMTKNKTMNVQFISKTSPYKVELTRNIALELLGELDSDRLSSKISSKTSETKLPPQKLSDRVTGYASFVDTDGSVYIQLSDEEDKLNTLTEQLQKDYAKGGQNLNQVAVGSMCCARYTEDDAWYRAVVLSVDKEITVRFVDYGNTDVLPQTRIASLSEKHIQVPALAYHCILHNYQSWTKESVDAFDKIIKDQPLTVKVITVADVFTVELYLDDGSNVAGKLPVTISAEKKDIPYPVIDFELGMKIDVHISHVESIHTFYVQPVVSENDLASLSSVINEHYSTLAPNINTAWMKLGCACVAKYTEDEQWYRGIITSVDKTSCGVYFVDYGNADIISKDNVHQLKKEYGTLQAQAVRCKLRGVEVSEAKLDEASDALLEMTTEKVVSVLGKGKIIEDESDVVLVDLMDGDKNIAAVLIESGLCTSISKANADIVALTENLNLTKATIMPITNLRKGQRLSVFISNVQSPSKFCVQLEKYKHHLEKLLNEMFNYFTDEESVHQTVLKGATVGHFCAVFSEEDESWYRAKIIKKDQKMCTVCFIDQGNTSNVDCSSLRILPEQFQDLPQQAVECCLAGIKSNDETWSEDTILFFHELIAYKSMLMDVLGFDESGICIVNLIHMGTAITQTLTEKGHGIVASTPIINKRIKRVFPDTNDTPVKLVFDNKDESVSDLLDTSEEYISETREVKLRFIQSDLKRGSMYKVLMKQVTDPSQFFCQLSSSSEEQNEYEEDIKKCAEALVRVDHSDVKPGMAVIIQMKDDDYFRRAQVISVNGNKVSVMYVDHGQKETVSFDQLWAMTSKLAAPVVSVFQCCLANCKPVGDSWSVPAIERFKELTCSKEYVVKVLASKDSIVAVELMDYTGLSVGQKLIEEQLALADVLIKTNTHSYQHDDESSFGLSVEDSTSLGIESINEDTIFGHPLLESTTILDFSEDQYPVLRLQLEREYNIEVIERGTPDHFAVRLLEQFSQLTKLDDLLSCFDREDKELEVMEEVGKPCLVRIQNKWYRGKKISEKHDSLSEVLLVDWGKNKIVDNSNIHKIPNSLLVIPLQVVYCKLAHIIPVENTGWSEDAVQFFQDFVRNRKLGAVVASISDDRTYNVRISDIQETGSHSINRQLIDLEFAQPLPGSAIDIEIQLEKTESNSDLLDEFEQSFHEVSYNRNNSYGGDVDETDENATTDEICHSFNTTGHSFSSILLNDSENDTLNLGGNTSILKFPDFLTPLPSTPKMENTNNVSIQNEQEDKGKYAWEENKQLQNKSEENKQLQEESEENKQLQEESEENKQLQEKSEENKQLQDESEENKQLQDESKENKQLEEEIEENRQLEEESEENKLQEESDVNKFEEESEENKLEELAQDKKETAADENNDLLAKADKIHNKKKTEKEQDRALPESGDESCGNIGNSEMDGDVGTDVQQNRLETVDQKSEEEIPQSKNTEEIVELETKDEQNTEQFRTETEEECCEKSPESTGRTESSDGTTPDGTTSGQKHDMKPQGATAGGPDVKFFNSENTCAQIVSELVMSVGDMVTETNNRSTVDETKDDVQL